MTKRGKDRWWQWLAVGVAFVLFGVRDWFAPGFLSLYNPNAHRDLRTTIAVEIFVGAFLIAAAIWKRARRQA